MLALSNRFLILLSIILFCFQAIQSVAADPGTSTKNNPSIYLSEELWEQVQDYLIPDDHPMKKNLDRIFSRSRALANEEAFLAAGFKSAKKQRFTKIIVTGHANLPGYMIKAYLDSQDLGPKRNQEHGFLIKRIMGARLARESITKHHYEHLIKVPDKWLYLLPDAPSPTQQSVRRMFILIEDDMNIYGFKENKKKWKSKHITKELLHALYTVITEVGFSDSTQPANCPIAKDGRVALVDTQMFNRDDVRPDKLTPYLSPSMRIYWEELIPASG